MDAYNTQPPCSTTCIIASQPSHRSPPRLDPTTAMSLNPSHGDLVAAQRALTQATRLHDFLLQQHNAGYGSRSHPSPSIQTLLAFLPAFAHSDRITATLDHLVGSSFDTDQARVELEIAQEALRGAVTREQVAQARVKELEVEIDRLQADLRMFTHMLTSSSHIDRWASPATVQVEADGDCGPRTSAGGDENGQSIGYPRSPSRSRTKTAKRASQFDALDQQPPRPAKHARIGLSAGALASQSVAANELRSEHDWLMVLDASVRKHHRIASLSTSTFFFIFARQAPIPFTSITKGLTFRHGIHGPSNLPFAAHIHTQPPTPRLFRHVSP
ncbi:hypothetical protein BCR44DRAFT_196358 [Catenaria anguillulae PL171]|uniref:Uncharacterized protein n=1 Tax=Catenaria anguillulae PL171 TaxID=765915 RepID=A0A1Y2HMJ8_9FUNG|nr:hypothetical protein BCR44DRAFT_196358 [Catenaria anguillulae PL171]